MMYRYSLAIVLALAAAGAARAETAVVDGDGDGVYSIEELTAAYPDMTAELFTTMDVDASGTIDADELQAARETGTIAG